jgi:methylmalonyl-CoA/ethylmalonyl-CoA epimerase
MVTGLSHVAIVVPDLAAAVRKLGDLYGLAVGTPMVNEGEGVRLAYAQLGNAKIELIEPSRPGTAIAKFLERNPRGGIHHLCLIVDDVAAAEQQFTARGARFTGDGTPRLGIDGNRIAFIHPQDFLGALVEIEEHRSVA